MEIKSKSECPSGGSMWLLRTLVALSLVVVFHAPADAAPNCLKVNAWYPKQVLLGNESGTGRLVFQSAAAVRSADFKNVHFVAIRFKATGVGSQIGVWAVSGGLPQKPADLKGLTLAVDGIAQQFTVWGDADRTAAQISKADRSVSAAKSCIR